MEREKLNTRQVAFMAVFAALTLLATYVVKIPTPVYGYIHAGDGFVLLAGIFLGPLPGAIAAGIGSALSDLIGGYPTWAPGTFAVKFLAALVAGAVYRRAGKAGEKKHKRQASYVILCGVIAELVMTGGYFLYNILLISLLNTEVSGAGMASAAVLAAAEIPFNLVQGALGVAVAAILTPLFSRRLRR